MSGAATSSQTPGESGASAERQAERFLEKKGLKLVTRNYRTRYGEIDLIMRDGATLVFVEVRKRTNTSRGFADGIDSVDIHKQRKLANAAQHFISRKMPVSAEGGCRFDVVAIGESIDWVQDAFTMDHI